MEFVHAAWPSMDAVEVARSTLRTRKLSDQIAMDISACVGGEQVDGVQGTAYFSRFDRWQSRIGAPSVARMQRPGVT